MSRSSDVDNGGDDNVVDTGGDFSDDDDVDNDDNGHSDGLLTALTDEQICTQSSITGLPNLLTRIIGILEFFQI